jgi:hypothetical protein
MRISFEPLPERPWKRVQSAEDVERYYQQHPLLVRGSKPVRTPLTANQHILHLLLTVVTCGLWLPVWIVRAVQGNLT